MQAETTAIVDESATQPHGAFRLNARQKSLYAFGDIADGLKNTALGTFLLFYLTAVCGLSGSLAGAAIAITLIASGAPVAHRLVPSSGSTAMSTLSELASLRAQPAPTVSPI